MITTTSSADNYFEFHGLSTDEKPLDIANGCVFVEMDTLKIFMFDGETKRWIWVNKSE